MATDSYMNFIDHLEDLRWCLLKSFLAVFLAFILSFLVSDKIFSFMVAPLKQSLKPGQNLIGTGVAEAFFTEIKVRWV